MIATANGCAEEHRRADLRGSSLYALDYVEVSASQTTLEAFFIGRAPPNLAAANVVVDGGRPVAVTGITVTRQDDLTLDDWMEVRVDRPGDFSTYTLSLRALDDRGRPTGKALDGLDPIYGSARFSFKASCPSDQDCSAPPSCPPAVRTQPAINYLAKDYGSFRQLILDRLAQTMPAWTEGHEPDVGVMLVELLAYVGDQLSYFQDAVATEAYLGTARRRISVRRHARLVDYAMHEGCNARAWLTIATDTPCTLDLDASDVFFCTAFPGAPGTHVLQLADLARATLGSFEVFEPVVRDGGTSITLIPPHNEIRFYTWGDCACCLPQGASSATLLDAWVTGDDGKKGRTLQLKPGDVLIFEEILGPRTGNPADADPTHRQAVRLTEVTTTIDPLYDREQGGRPVVQITWCSEDALAFPLCLSAVMPAPDCSCRADVSVARGNVILVDSGMTISGVSLGIVPTETSEVSCATDCAPPSVILTPGRFHPVLPDAPLTFAQAPPACGCASMTITQDPRQALPAITLTGTLDAGPNPVTTHWSARATLLESGPDDLDFVVEVDDDGRARLRFGNGDEGQLPGAGTAFAATYRVGNGTDGNVGAGTIVYAVFPPTSKDLAHLENVTLTPRNPLPAVGGTSSEPVAEARWFAPYAFRDVLERAITADDYATLAADNARRLAERSRLFSPMAPAPTPSATDGDPRRRADEDPGEADALPPDLCSIPFQRLRAARGTLRWTGSWYQVEIAVDPLGSETAAPELLAEVAAYLQPYRRVGHDLGVEGARYVPLDLGLSVCVKPGYLRADVEAALRAALGTGVLADGSPALFDPDQLTFGQGVYPSRVVAVVQATPGVMEAQVTRLTRYVPGAPPPRATPDQVPSDGVLALGPFEIARLDNDPNAPGNGRLTIVLRGGR